MNGALPSIPDGRERSDERREKKSKKHTSKRENDRDRHTRRKHKENREGTPPRSHLRSNGPVSPNRTERPDSEKSRLKSRKGLSKSDSKSRSYERNSANERDHGDDGARGGSLFNKLNLASASGGKKKDRKGSRKNKDRRD